MSNNDVSWLSLKIKKLILYKVDEGDGEDSGEEVGDGSGVGVGEDEDSAVGEVSEVRV